MIALKCNLSHPWVEYSQKCTNLVSILHFAKQKHFANMLAVYTMATHHCLRYNNRSIVVLDVYIPGQRPPDVAKEQIGSYYGIWIPFTVSIYGMLPYSLITPLTGQTRVIAFAVFRLRYIGLRINSPNPTLEGTIAVIWTQIELDYSVMACTIPCLKPFMIAVSTNYGSIAPTKTTINGSNGLSGDRSKGSFALTSVKTKSPVPTDLGESKLRMDKVFNSTSVTYNGQPDQHSVGSNDSTKMIIKKETEWSIERELAKAPRMGQKVPDVEVAAVRG